MAAPDAPDFDIANTAIKYGIDGSAVVPTDRALAAARLRALEADPGVVEAVLTPSHPQHADRMAERRALLLVANGKSPG